MIKTIEYIYENYIKPADIEEAKRLKALIERLKKNSSK